MTEQLKPCPFCGGKADYYRLDGYFSVHCKNEVLCGIKNTHLHETKENACIDWNIRVNEEDNKCKQ